MLRDGRTGECDVWNSCLSHLQVLGVSGGNERTDEGEQSRSCSLEPRLLSETFASSHLRVLDVSGGMLSIVTVVVIALSLCLPSS